MCQVFDSELRRLIADIPGIEIIPNLARKQITDNLLLDLLAWQFHCDFYSTDFSIEQKQEIILKSLDWHTRKGTPSVIEEIVTAVFSKAEVKEWFDYGGLPYRFIVGINEDMPDQETKESLVRAINSVKNARSFLEKIITILYHEDEIHAIDFVQIKTVRQDVDVYPVGLRLNGRINLDHGRLLHLDGADALDGSWLLDRATPSPGTVRDTAHIPSNLDGTWPLGDQRKLSGNHALYAPEAIDVPATLNSGQRDELSAHLKLERLEDRFEISPRLDGYLLLTGLWNLGKDLPPMVDNPMAIKITRHLRLNGKFNLWARPLDGSMILDGSGALSSREALSGNKTTFEEVL
jgi:phage tail P2-like protein